MKKLPAVLAAVLLVSIAGCREILYSGVSESDANEMLSTLLKHGVDATKENAGKTGYNVTVDEQDMIRALDIIRENSLPRTAYQNVGQIFSGQSMISSQLEEQARFAFGISQELSATFGKIDGVLDSRVHVVLAQRDQATGSTTPPSAAVFIRHTPQSAVVNLIGEIKETTCRAVPGLNLDKVSVMLEVYREQILAPRLKVTPWYETPQAMVGFGALGMLVLLGGILGALVKTGKITLPGLGKHSSSVPATKDS